MKPKHLIIVGITLLVSGIVLRLIWSDSFLPILMMISGIACKLTFIGLSIRDKVYKPGKEMFLLYLGLCVFFTGLYFKRHGVDLAPLLMTMGIVMKLLFVILFIKKFRAAKRTL